MNSEIEYEFVLKFSSFSKVGEFLADLEAWQEYKSKKADRKLSDKRGQHTKIYHQQAREYMMENPTLSYRECMQFVRSKDV